MMRQKSKFISYLLVILTALTLGCQTIENFSFFNSSSVDSAPTPVSWPQSTFLPPQKSRQVIVRQAVPIETLHTSNQHLTSIEIFINNQPIRAEETAGQTNVFPAGPDGLVDLRVRLENGDLVSRSRVEPESPTSQETVSLVWIGNIPGTYDLKLVTTDVANATTEITQRIEVVDAAQ